MITSSEILKYYDYPILQMKKWKGDLSKITQTGSSGGRILAQGYYTILSTAIIIITISISTIITITSSNYCYHYYYCHYYY